MSSTKKKHKKKKIKFKAVFVAVFVVALAIFVGVSLFKHSLKNNLNQIKEKINDCTPNGFNYPTDYEEYVVKYSKEYDVDPILVFSVIKVESDFDPNAVSDAGARGLMQLMEDAYDWIKFRLNDQREHSYDNIVEPELNIQYGSYYLSYLMDKYDDSIELSAAAYHCGMSLVDGWLEDGIVDADNFNIEDIPKENDQTAYYVKKIKKAYSNYQEILCDSDIVD